MYNDLERFPKNRSVTQIPHSGKVKPKKRMNDQGSAGSHQDYQKYQDGSRLR